MLPVWNAALPTVFGLHPTDCRSIRKCKFAGECTYKSSNLPWADNIKVILALDPKGMHGRRHTWFGRWLVCPTSGTGCRQWQHEGELNICFCYWPRAVDQFDNGRMHWNHFACAGVPRLQPETENHWRQCCQGIRRRNVHLSDLRSIALSFLAFRVSNTASCA